MMKKFLNIIGFLMFASALFSPAVSRTVLGADGGSADTSSTTDASGCSFPWISCNTASRMQVNIPDTDWGATFGSDNPEEVGQDLYKNILGMTRLAPDQKAFKNTAGAFGTTESSMVRLLNNDIGPILEKNPYITQQDAVKIMTNIQQRYAEEKDIYDLQSDVDASVMPNEIFENGDTSDSGFDLINDLNNIQTILFNKADPIDIGGNVNASSHGSIPGTGSGASGIGSGQGGEAGAGTGVGPGPSSGAGENTGTSGNALRGGQNVAATTGGTGLAAAAGGSTSGLGLKPDATQNPNICFGSSQIDNALKDFNQNKAVDPHYKETPTQPTAGVGALGTVARGLNTDGTQQSGAGENTGIGSSALTGGTNSGEFNYNPPAAQIAQPAAADDWLKALPCTDVLCIQVNFVTKPASAYVDSDNCIACHVEKINEKLKETVMHSLIPGKATGNLLEPGICSEATADLFRSVNMRFYAIAKPLLTPTNDDLIYGTNMTDEWDKFVNTYKPFPFYEANIPDPNDSNTDTFVPTVEDTAAKTALSMATPDTTFQTVNKNIQQQITGIQNQIAKNVAVAESAVQTDVDSSFYQSIKTELDQMNFYFLSFQEILHRLHEKVGDVEEDHACDGLNNLKECKQ